MRFAILALTVLSSTNSFANPAGRITDLQVAQSRHVVMAEIATLDAVFCDLINRKPMDKARPVCEGLARDEARERGEEIASVLSSTARLGSLGAVNRLRDGRCSVRSTTVHCSVSLLVGSPNSAER